MKRLFALLIILITIVGGVSADDAYSFPFTLLLRRNGTDSVWFTKSGDYTDTDKISLHIFPIIYGSDTTKSSVTSTVYLRWLKQSSNDVRIKITFVGNESTDLDSTFMLWCASGEGEAKGINFDVEIKDKNNKDVWSLIFKEASDDASDGVYDASYRSKKLTDKQRSITFDPADTTLAYESPLKINMTINPTLKGTDGIYHWGVDIQFVGYIKATIIAAT